MQVFTFTQLGGPTVPNTPIGVPVIAVPKRGICQLAYREMQLRIWSVAAVEWCKYPYSNFKWGVAILNIGDIVQ